MLLFQVGKIASYHFVFCGNQESRVVSNVQIPKPFKIVQATFSDQTFQTLQS